MRDEKKRRYVEDRTEQEIGREVREIMRESDEFRHPREDEYYEDGSGRYNRRTGRAISRQTGPDSNTREARRRGDSGAEYRKAVERKTNPDPDGGYGRQYPEALPETDRDPESQS